MFEFFKKSYHRTVMLALFLGFVFILINSYIISNIENHFYELKEREVESLAKDYGDSVLYSTQAHDLIRSLIREKMLIASKIVELEERDLIRTDLRLISEMLEVHKVNIYDESGNVIRSSHRDSMGSNVYEENLAKDFIDSGRDIDFITNISPEPANALQYFYGFYRLSSRKIVQISILSETVNNFINKFHIDNTLKEIEDSSHIKEAYFYNVNLKSSNEISNLDQLDREDKNALLRIFINENDRLYSKLEKNSNLFQVFVPIKSKNQIIGALRLDYSFESTEKLLATIRKVSTGVFIMIYLLIVFTSFMSTRMNNKLENIAYYDSLTGLANVDYFFSEFSVKNTLFTNNQMILVIKFPTISMINMTHGYTSGSEILVRIAKRLEILTKNKESSIFKYRSDEFIIYWKPMVNGQPIESFIEDLNEFLLKPFIINEAKLFLKHKIAIIKSEDHQLEKTELLKKSNIVLNSIMGDKHKNYAFYDDVMALELQRIEKIRHELEDIIERKNKEHQIYMNYQPLIDLRNESVWSFEALARFDSKTFGWVSPAEFINIAEENRLIISLSYLLITQSFLFLNKLLKEGVRDTRVAINISGAHLISERFLADIIELAAMTNIPLNLVEIEVTESMVMKDFSMINNKLKELQALGVKIAMDDFGTGYSSFARLEELNIDVIKIDKKFIDKIINEDPSQIILGDIIAMAHRLGLKVVAEGVETTEQVTYLLKRKCDIIQGYYYSKPLSNEDALEYLINTKSKK